MTDLADTRQLWARLDDRAPLLDSDPLCANWMVDDTWRISRDIADAIRVMQRLRFSGLRVIYMSQGIDTFPSRLTRS